MKTEKRKAKLGEWILLTNSSSPSPYLKNGNKMFVIEISEDKPGGVWAELYFGAGTYYWIDEGKYEVITEE